MGSGTLKIGRTVRAIAIRNMLCQASNVMKRKEHQWFPVIQTERMYDSIRLPDTGSSDDMFEVACQSSARRLKRLKEDQ